MATSTDTTRADHAFAALTAYRRSTIDRAKVDMLREGGDLTEEVFTDLLADLRHLADELDVDFDEVNERGGWHYSHEVG